VAEITINGISLDPVTQSEELATASLVSEDASESNYILIQTSEPVTGDQKAQLAALGVVIHEYVSTNTYLCGYRGSDLDAIRTLPFVVWADVYFRGFKIPPSLRPVAPSEPSPVLPVPVGELTSRAAHEVDVVLHDDVDADSGDLKARVAAAARLNVDNLQVGRHKFHLVVQERYLDDIAAIDEVRHLEEVPKVHLTNNIARTIINADVLINGTHYQGAGQIIAVADTGFDRGSRTNVHPAFAGRVAHLYALGRTNPDRTDDPDGHGTHVAGSALGDGTSATMGGSIQGTAPRARLVLQSLLDGTGNLNGIPADLHDLFRPPYDNDGARVHTNSWASNNIAGQPYNQRAREIDDFVWNHQDMVICKSAGNDGTDANGDGVVDTSSVGGEASAKNCITVGASESNRNSTSRTYGGGGFSGSFPARPINPDRVGNSADGMAAFSSRGPTVERRFKPDVVGPGTCILSSRSRNQANASTFYGTSSDNLFWFDGGTSMATPLVAGCAAVLRETLVRNGTPNPSAALIKALLINGAVELVGQYTPSEAGRSPNNNSGFGRVNLGASVIIPGPHPNAGCGDGGPLREGGEEDTVLVHVPGSTLKVTLVWTDPQGPLLQNDLDLIVRAPNGQERHGNMGTSESFDRFNNVEQVVWEHIPSGDVKIIIRAFRITNFPQPYAYAWRLS